jgi:hypothetical protein
MPVDLNDPCARAAWLRETYFGAVAGSQETLIRQRGPDSEQEVRFHKMDLATLRAEMTRAEDECRSRRQYPPTRREEE